MNRCRWLPDAPNGDRTLEITTGRVSHVYEVAEVAGGFLLSRFDESDAIVTYRIDTTDGRWWRCDCPAAKFNRGTCKHLRGLRAALRSLPF